MNKISLPEDIIKYLKSMDNIKSCSRHTLRAYCNDLAQAFDLDRSELWGAFCEDVSNIKFKNLPFSAPDLAQWGRLSPASRNRKFATLKSFYGWAFENKLTSEDLSLNLTCPKVPRKIPHFISVDEVSAVLATFQGEQSPNAILQKALFLLLYGGGLRVSEACNAKWSDLIQEGRALRILGKGGKERIVILPQPVSSYLQQMKQNASGQYVLGDRPLNTRVAYQWIKDRGSRAGLLHNLHPHSLRHSFATHMLSSGASLRTLQELLGHESLRATEKYTHLSIDQLARTMDQTHPLGSNKTTKSHSSDNEE